MNHNEPRVAQQPWRGGEAFALRAFDELPDVYLFAKDRDLRFVYGNHAFLKLMRQDCLKDLIGKRDDDLSPPHLVERYRRGDMHVLSTATPLTNLIELVTNESGSYDWFKTIKFPALDENGQVVGVVGVTRNLTPRQTYEPFGGLAQALEAIVRAEGRTISCDVLAGMVNLSVSQLRRRFKAELGMSPHQYIKQVRLTVASELLWSTELSLATIAARTGFFDQSHMTNVFMRERGTAPGRYRHWMRGIARARGLIDAPSATGARVAAAGTEEVEA